MNKINCSNCFTLINKSGLKLHQSSKKCTSFIAVKLPQINAVNEIINMNAEIEINSENWNEIINEVQIGTCYICMVDELQLVETCGRLIHQVCNNCRKQIKKCPMCRVDIEQLIDDNIRIKVNLLFSQMILSVTQNTIYAHLAQNIINSFVANAPLYIVDTIINDWILGHCQNVDDALLQDLDEIFADFDNVLNFNTQTLIQIYQENVHLLI